MHWLHIPKTGSSFGTTVVHRGCPRIPVDAAADDGAPIVSLTERYGRANRRWCDRNAFLGNLNGHEPVRYPTHQGHTIAILRNPRDRLLSECAAIDSEFRRAFGARDAEAQPTLTFARRSGVDQHRGVHVRSRGRRRRAPWEHTFGSKRRLLQRVKPALQGSARGEKEERVLVRTDSIYSHPFLREFLYSHGLSHAAMEALRSTWNRENHSIPLRACLTIKGLKGCQVKMVLGVPCAAPFAINASLLDEAARRVRHDFLFVGLTERWEHSVCLFHARLGGRPVRAQFANGRRGTYRHREASGFDVVADTSTKLHVKGPFIERLLADTWDEQLYRVAMERFEKDINDSRVSRAASGRVVFTSSTSCR